MPLADLRHTSPSTINRNDTNPPALRGDALPDRHSHIKELLASRPMFASVPQVLCLPYSSGPDRSPRARGEADTSPLCRTEGNPVSQVYRGRKTFELRRQMKAPTPKPQRRHCNTMSPFLRPHQQVHVLRVPSPETS